MQHSGRLRRAVRLSLPLPTIVTVRAAPPTDVALHVRGCWPFVVSTFSRQVQHCHRPNYL
jgi:hypothetical protein